MLLLQTPKISFQTKVSRENRRSDSNTNLKNLPLETSFIEIMRTTWGNKEVPKAFCTNSIIVENTIQSVWLQNNGNPAILWHLKRHNFAKILAKKRDCLLVAVSSLWPNPKLWLLLLEPVDLTYQNWSKFCFCDATKTQNAELPVKQSRTD